MGKLKEIQINRFDGGIAFDERMASANQFSKSLNFDIFKKPSTLSPIRGIESDEGFDSVSDGIKQYDLGSFGSNSSGSIVYAFGRKTSSNTGVKLYSKFATGANWTEVTGLISDVSQPMEQTAGSPVPGTSIITTVTSGGESLLWG